MFSCEFCKISTKTYFYRTPLVAASECSTNLEFGKQTDQKFVTQNLHHGKEYWISKKKKLLKYCQKELIYEYTSTFVGWWSIFWEVAGSGGYILAGCGWWWMVVGGNGWWWIYFGWWWLVVDGIGWWWIYSGWWWVEVDCGGWWHSLIWPTQKC